MRPWRGVSSGSLPTGAAASQPRRDPETPLHTRALGAGGRAIRLNDQLRDHDRVQASHRRGGLAQIHPGQLAPHSAAAPAGLGRPGRPRRADPCSVPTAADAPAGHARHHPAPAPPPHRPEMDLPAPDRPAAGQRRDHHADQAARHSEPGLGISADPRRAAQAWLPGQRVNHPPGPAVPADTPAPKRHTGTGARSRTSTAFTASARCSGETRSPGHLRTNLKGEAMPFAQRPDAQIWWDRAGRATRSCSSWAMPAGLACGIAPPPNSPRPTGN